METSNEMRGNQLVEYQQTKSQKYVNKSQLSKINKGYSCLKTQIDSCKLFSAAICTVRFSVERDVEL